MDLNEIHGTPVHRGSREPDARGTETLILRMNLPDFKGRKGDSIRHERALERADGVMSVGLENEFRPVRFVRPDHGSPTHVAHRDFGLFPESKRFRVELERLVLIIYEHAGQYDLHCPFLSLADELQLCR